MALLLSPPWLGAGGSAGRLHLAVEALGEALSKSPPSGGVFPDHWEIVARCDVRPPAEAKEAFSTDGQLLERPVGWVEPGADILQQLEDCAEVLAARLPRFTLTTGDSGVEVPLVAYHLHRDPGLAVLWLDAHGDLNSPDSSPSGNFHGMPLGLLLGAGAWSKDYQRLVPVPLDPARLLFLGVRDLDPPEVERVSQLGLRVVSAGANLVGEVQRFLAALGEGTPVYLHLDFDVLDPSAFPVRSFVPTPAADGMSRRALLSVLAAVRSAHERGTCRLVGVGVTELATDAPEAVQLAEDLLGEGLGASRRLATL